MKRSKKGLFEGARQEQETFHGGFWRAHLGEIRSRGAVGQNGVMVSGRLLPGTDLLSGVMDMARSFGVEEAVFWCFGSLARARFSTGVRRESPSSEDMKRIPPHTVEGPVELLFGMGKLGLPSSGDPVVHLHGAFVTAEGVVMGGHFFPGGNPVYATMEVLIQEVLGIEHRWKEDPESGVTLIESLPKQTLGADHEP